MNDPRDAKINELKKTSIAYANWQYAIRVRNQIAVEAGTSGEAYRRAQDHVKFWCTEWKNEEATVQVELSHEMETALLMFETALQRIGASGEHYPIEAATDAMLKNGRVSEDDIDVAAWKCKAA